MLVTSNLVLLYLVIRLTGSILPSFKLSVAVWFSLVVKAECNPGRSLKNQCKVLNYLSWAMVTMGECSKTEPLSGSVPSDSDEQKLCFSSLTYTVTFVFTRHWDFGNVCYHSVACPILAWKAPYLDKSTTHINNSSCKLPLYFSTHLPDFYSLSSQGWIGLYLWTSHDEARMLQT